MGDFGTTVELCIIGITMLWTLPALNRIADALERIADVKEDEVEDET